jgi:UDP-glucose 4-epimerase
MARVMVCGGAGFVGSHLVERLLADSREVDVVDDLSTGSLANLATARAMGGSLRFHHLDVTSLEFGELVGLRNPDVIYHLAILQPSASDSLSITRSLPALLGVLEAARRHRVGRVVVAIPAGLLYGEIEAKYQPVKEGRRTEAIGVSHVMAHTMVDVLNVYRERYGIEFCALAMSNVYGLRQRPQDGVVAAFSAAVVRGIDAEIFGSGKQTRDFLFIDDAVDALARAFDRGGGLVVNIGTGVATSIEEVWKLVAMGSSLKARKTATREEDITRLALSNVRAKIQLGWAPWTPVVDGIAAIRDTFPTR